LRTRGSERLPGCEREEKSFICVLSVLHKKHDDQLPLSK
jgi:hypothetical protein